LALVVLLVQTAVILFFLALQLLAVVTVRIVAQTEIQVVLVVEPETGLVGRQSLEVLELRDKDLLAVIHQPHNILAALEVVVLVQWVFQ
jgi:hypothetical protein